MSTLIFDPPSGPEMENPPLELLEALILNPAPGYWEQGTGNATLKWVEDHSSSELFILPNPQYGIYLRYLDSSGEASLSLHDPSRLAEVAPCSEHWFASVGLFLHPQEAMKAIREFCTLRGHRSDSIRWIDPESIPEGGNW